MSRHNRQMLLVLAALTSVFLFGGVTQIMAHDYQQGRNGYWDNHGYHEYGYHHNHRGYWHHDNSGARIWISIQ